MMSLLSDAAPVSAPLALAKHHYSQALELEKQLRSLLQGKGPFDSSVRSLQNSLREKYELVILDDHELAESHEVEQAIWRLHYKQIDEFRAKIKKINYAASTPKSGTQRDSVIKIIAAFKSFLAEVTGFYHNLIFKLRAKHGLPQDNYSAFESSDTVATSGDDAERRARVKRCQLSCHRCLIFLGDLARYKEVHGNVQDARSIDFSVAAGYYLQAASLWPPSGNPHNQLAVLATYVSDELLAVYRYFRSLAVETPFLTARDNLILLFEKNRLQYSQLHVPKSAVQGGGSQMSPTRRGDRVLPYGGATVKLAKKDVKSENVDVTANPPKSPELRRSFHIRFVRMNGILFTRTSLETFLQVYLETLSDLEQLLAGNDSILEAGLGTDYQSRTSMGNAGPSCVIQLVAILIFTIHNINWSADAANHPTYAEILQRSDLFQHALTAAFECVGRIMHRCGQSKDPARSVLLPALLMFMEWLAGRPEMAIGNEVNIDQANARSSFWAECLVLLNCFLKTFKEEADANNGFEGGISIGSFGGTVGNERGFALSEDFELQGFIPLAPAQTALDYSKGPLREGKGDKQVKIRIKRFLAAGKAVATALESTQRGICYDEDSDKFVLAGEARQGHKEEEHVGTDIEDTVVSLEEEESDTGNTLNFLDSDSHLEEEPSVRSSAKVINKEEDEEVIVFKPLSKDRPPVTEASTPSYAENFAPAFHFSPLLTSEVSVQATPMSSVTGKNPWLPGSSVNVQSGSAVSKFQGPFHTSQGPVQYSSKEGSYPLDSCKVASSSKSGLVELATPLPLVSVTGSSTGLIPLVHDASVTMSKMHMSGLNSLGNEASVTRSRDFPLMSSSVTSSGNWLDTPQYTSLSTEAWFQAQKNVFMNFPDKRVGAGAAVSSQGQNDVRSLWSSEREPLDRYGVSGFIPSGIPNDRLNGEIALNSSSLPLLTSSETSSGFESGKYPVAGNRDAIVTTSSSWNVKEYPVHSRVSHPTMRPPPGFGPLPGKSVAKPVLGISQGIFQPPSTFQSQRPNIGEDNVDDYGWLDDFRSVKPVTSQPVYSGERESQLSSSSRNLWSVSDGISKSAAFDSAPFPFPGMGALHHRKFNTTAPLHIQAQSSYSEPQLSYSERQKPIDEAQAHVKVQAELQQLQQQQLMFLQRQQQQYQQQLPGQFHSRDPFVS